MRNLLSINQILDWTYSLYRKYIVSFIGFTSLMLMISVSIIYGIFFIVSILFTIILVGALSFGSTNILGFGSSNIIGSSLESTILWGIVIYGCLAFIVMLSYTFMNMVAAGPVKAVEEFRKGNRVSFGIMFTYSFKKMLYVITSTMAFYFILSIIVAIGIVTYGLNYIIWLQNVSMIFNVFVGTFIGVIVLVGCIWFAVKGAFYLQVALYEKKHFLSAIIGSFKLVKGQFKRIFCILFSSILSFYVVYFSLGGLVSVGSNFLPMFMTGKEGTGLFVAVIIFQLLLMLFQFALSIVITPIQHITLPIIYFDERNRKYGDDLHRKVDKLIQIQNSALKAQ
ncbi:MAG: hypothetical protein CVV02_04200 [Firmicutes bacterium HGW-Firmicutes-7]|nr:MAG: hypothetical protein CVV02_04200 [Firmicutes bacterium HGW-Firmicutes-7]